MKPRRSIILISAGTILLVAAVLNIFVDIPDAINNYQFERALTKTVQGPNISSTFAEAPVNSTASIPDRQVTTTPAVIAEPTPTLEPIIGYIPDWIIIPAIKVDAPVIPSTQSTLEIRDQWFEQWTVPDQRAAGWQANSAPLGEVGNTVIGGHHNAYGKVFGHLVELEIGDLVYLYSGQKVFIYEVVDKQLLKEVDVSLDIRRANGEWIAHKDDERITLVTCWPKRGNSHRVIIVAKPVE